MPEAFLSYTQLWLCHQGGNGTYKKLYITFLFLTTDLRKFPTKEMYKEIGQ